MNDVYHHQLMVAQALTNKTDSGAEQKERLGRQQNGLAGAKRIIHHSRDPEIKH
jgi:hypothetical protein